MVHVSESLGVNLGDLVVDQKQTLMEKKGIGIRFYKFTLGFAPFLTPGVRMEALVLFFHVFVFVKPLFPRSRMNFHAKHSTCAGQDREYERFI